METENKELVALAKTLPGYQEDDGDDNGGRGYIGWSPHGDYLWVKKERGGWNTQLVFETWEEFKKGFAMAGCDLGMNLPADFYFGVDCPVETCDACEGDFWEPRVRILSNTFYATQILNPEFDLMKLLEGKYTSDPFNRDPVANALANQQAWRDKITADEAKALVDGGRLRDYTHDFDGTKEGAARWVLKKPLDEIDYEALAEKVNEGERAARKPGGGFGHDGINQHILLEARAKRLFGLEKEECLCPKCKGEGNVRTGPDRLYLYIWMLHPRKGASRGIDVHSVKPEELPEVKEWLRRSWELHKRHFAWALKD